MENLVKDNRFSHLATDPSFRRAPKYERKVKIDKRFQSMFTDDKFKVRYAVDKRGRPVSYSSNENLRKYYALSSDEEEDNGKTSSDDSEDEESPVLESISGEEVANITEKVLYDEDCKPFTSDEKQEPDKEKTKSSRTSGGFKVTNLSVPKPIINAAKAKKEKISDKVREKLKNLDVDYARGESAILTDSSSDDESSDDSVAEFEEKMAHEWGELDKDAGTTDQSTSRLAVCNMDWDRIRAADLMVLFSSFTPVEGYLKSVTIYPSEFGLERMKEEDVKGPTELVSEKRKEEEDNEDEEGGSYHMEILRKYQLNRLKYFYAVVECDSVATADKLYAECDGLEYESSAIRLDLRFIPDDMVFDQKPREVCNGIPDPTKYKPRFFITKALQQAKVECTWDETNPDRLEIAEKIMKSNGEVDDEDIQAYLASSSGESEAESEKLEDDNAKIDGDEEERIAKYRALIADIQEKEKAKSSKDVEMEVTWGIGLKNETEKLVKQKLKEQEELTPFEKYLEKRKEKRKQKRKERKQANSKDDDAAFSDDDLPSDVDLDDPYFKEELEGLKKGKAKKKGDSAKIKDSAEEARRENYRAQLKLLMMDFEEKKNHFNMDEIMKQEKESGKKKKRKAKKTEEEKPVKDDFELNVKDPRFEALYSSHLYNIDPADPHFKKTKAMEALVNEKLNRRNQLDVSSEKTSEEPDTTKKNDAELSLLVKSVKRKAENLKAKKKQKC